MKYRIIKNTGCNVVLFNDGRKGICKYDEAENRYWDPPLGPGNCSHLKTKRMNFGIKHIIFFMDYAPGVSYIEYNLIKKTTTIIVNGVKTQVKVQSGDSWDYQTGFLYAYMKYVIAKEKSKMIGTLFLMELQKNICNAVGLKKDILFSEIPKW